MKGRLLKIENTKGKVVGAKVKIGRKEEFFECKSIILCTGGYSQYFNKSSYKTGIEIAFNAGAKINNLEFVLYHPFGLRDKVVPTESLRKAKIFDSKGNRLKELEKILEKGNAHHKLSKMVQCIYKTNSKIIAILGKQKLKFSPLPYSTLGGMKVNSNFMSNLKGLFAAGETISGFNGADRIGGTALSECVYSGIAAGKESVEYNKKNKIKLNNLKLKRKIVLIQQSVCNFY